MTTLPRGVEGATPRIPLSRLVNVHDMWVAAGAESPIGDGLCEYVRAHGDEAERGEDPDVTGKMVSGLRKMCWGMLTRLSVEADMFQREKFSTTPSSYDTYREVIVNVVEFSIAVLHRIEVTPTKQTVLEYVNEVHACWKKDGYPYLESMGVVVQVINEQSEIINAVLGSSR